MVEKISTVDEKDVAKKTRAKKYMGNVKCHECGSSDTHTRANGKLDWYRYYSEKEEWDGVSYLCHKCYVKKYQSGQDSQCNIIKSMRSSRIGSLDRFVNHGKAVIGQWIAGKVLGLKDLNIEIDNFKVPIDLSEHAVHGKIDVKASSLSVTYGIWSFPIKDRGFDNIIILCMSKSFDSVERVYIIPKIEFLNRIHISIVKSPSKGVQWYEKYRIDEKCYNDVYRSVEIPRFFSPFDLWNDKYSKMR